MINKTHRGLGQMVVMNILSAKAKKAILNVSPAGCGKSTATNVVAAILRERATKYTSLTLAGLHRKRKELTNYEGHLIIDDLGAEKSIWARTSTITTLSNLVYSHYIHKLTQAYDFTIENFNGSTSLNIQPVLLDSLIQTDDWVALVRDKVIRYYHLVRPSVPKAYPPEIDISWGEPLHNIELPKHRGRKWYDLIYIGLTQWSHARVLEHIPDYLKACAALDSREKVNVSDYNLLLKLLKPMQLERYIIETYGFETGRVFNNNLYCILVEIVSFKEPTIKQLAVDYKCSPKTVRRLCEVVRDWCWINSDNEAKVLPTEPTKEILEICGAYEKW